MIDRKVVDEYLKLRGIDSLDPMKYTIVEIEDIFPIDRINEFLN